MKVRCITGFFIFEETSVGQVSDFMSLTGLEIVPWRSAFTFSALAEAPGYSIQGSPLLGVPATKSFAGEPWEVLDANGFVFDFGKGLVVPIESVTQVTSIKMAGNRFVSPGLILPGSVTADAKRVASFTGWFSRQTLRWLYSEVTYV